MISWLMAEFIIWNENLVALIERDVFSLNLNEEDCVISMQ